MRNLPITGCDACPCNESEHGYCNLKKTVQTLGVAAGQAPNQEGNRCPLRDEDVLLCPAFSEEKEQE
jgi:hypothetical protein